MSHFHPKTVPGTRVPNKYFLNEPMAISSKPAGPESDQSKTPSLMFLTLIPEALNLTINKLLSWLKRATKQLKGEGNGNPL